MAGYSAASVSICLTYGVIPRSFRYLRMSSMSRSMFFAELFDTVRANWKSEKPRCLASTSSVSGTCVMLLYCSSSFSIRIMFSSFSMNQQSMRVSSWMRDTE